MRPFVVVAVAAALLGVLTGCGDPPPPPPGALTGFVAFTGTVPPPRTIQIYRDHDTCKERDGEQVQDVVVAADGGLEGVVVEIHGVVEPATPGTPAPRIAPATAAIVQKGCRFVPHVLVVAEDTVVEIHNADPLVHKVNCDAWQHDQQPDSKLQVQVPATRRGFVRLNCNLHSWMEMWVYVPRSRWWARTGADGRFRIDGLPAGSYRATAAHPQLGRRRIAVTVTPAGTAECRFEFD